jgi:uncharacterized protein HemX
MDLLWLALIIQCMFYIVYDAHLAIIIFIVLSIVIRYFTKNALLFLLVPMIFAHIGYLFLFARKNGTTERFSIRKKMREFRKRMKEWKNMANVNKKENEELKQDNRELEQENRELKQENNAQTQSLQSINNTSTSNS